MNFEINYEKDYKEKLEDYNQNYKDKKWMVVLGANIFYFLGLFLFIDFNSFDIQEKFGDFDYYFVYGIALIMGLIIPAKKFDKILALHKNIEKEYHTPTKIKLKDYITKEKLGLYYDYVVKKLKEEHDKKGYISLYSMYKIMELMDDMGTLDQNNVSIKKDQNKDFLDSL